MEGRVREKKWRGQHHETDLTSSDGRKKPFLPRTLVRRLPIIFKHFNLADLARSSASFNILNFHSKPTIELIIEIIICTYFFVNYLRTHYWTGD